MGFVLMISALERDILEGESDISQVRTAPALGGEGKMNGLKR